MGKPNFLAVLPLLMLVCGGCRLCPDCDLDSYGAYGGRWQRTERDRGLVGSVFIPAGAMVPYAETAEQDSGEESEADSMYREDDSAAGGLDVEDLDDETLESDIFDSLEDEPGDSVLESAPDGADSTYQPRPTRFGTT